MDLCHTWRWNWIWATTTSQSRLLYQSNCGRNLPQIVTVWIFFTTGANVLQSAGHYWRLSDSGQRRRGSIQTETSQQIPAVYWTGFSGSLSHLHGKTNFTSIDFRASWAIGHFEEIRNLQVLLTSRGECSRRLTHGVVECVKWGRGWVWKQSSLFSNLLSFLYLFMSCG